MVAWIGIPIKTLILPRGKKSNLSQNIYVSGTNFVIITKYMDIVWGTYVSLFSIKFSCSSTLSKYNKCTYSGEKDWKINLHKKESNTCHFDNEQETA